MDRAKIRALLNPLQKELITSKGLHAKLLYQKLHKSLGVFVALAPFLGERGFLKLQRLSRWWYNFGIGRVQWKITAPTSQIYFAFMEKSSAKVMSIDPYSPNLIKQISHARTMYFSNKGWLSC